MANIDNNSRSLRSKRSRLSILPIALSGLLAGGALAGSAVSIWHISKNYTEGADFVKTVNGRIKIDPFAGLTDAQKHEQHKEDAERTLADCAEKLSRWLKDKGQPSYDVSYECYETEDDHTFDCYLNAQFQVDKVAHKDPISDEEKETKIDNDPYLTFFSNRAFNSNEKTFVYRWYQKEHDDNTKPSYTVIPFRDIFYIPKTVDEDTNRAKPLVNEDGENGVMFHVEGSEEKQVQAQLFTDIYKDLAEAKKDSEDQPEPEPSNDPIANEWQPRLYIVNNINNLFNEANYHLSNWFVNKDNREDYLKWYFGTEYPAFAEQYKTKDFKGGERQDQDKYFKLASAPKHGDDIATYENLDIFNYIDQATPGTNALSFTNKYIEKIVTMTDFDKVMPAKITDDYKNETEAGSEKIDYFWYPLTTKNEAQSYLNNQIKYGFNTASIETFNLDDEEEADDVLDHITGEDFQNQFIAPTFSETIFGGNNVIGILSLGFLIYLVALLVILAVLYRTTGVMSWICMIFALSMTGLIATAGATAISMALLIGLLTMSIVGFMACLAICGRMKRRLNSREDTQIIINKTFKKSLLPIVDMSVIALIFGICFTYIAPIALNAFGLVLIIGALMTFVSVYLLNGLIHSAFFNNNIMVGKYQFFGKPSNHANEALSQSNNAVPSSMDATKLEIPYYSSMSTRKIDTTNKWALIAVSVVGLILIVGIIVFSILGFTSSSMFHTSTCVAIKFDGNIFQQDWFNGLSYLSYKHDSASGWWYFYTNASNAAEIAKGFTGADNVFVQYIFGSTNQDILNFALISIIVATLLSAVYALIRYNWISFVPMIAGAFAMPLLMVGIGSICQIKFDGFVIMVFALMSIVNTVYCANTLCSVGESWSRKDAYDNNELRYIVNASLTNNWTFVWNTGLAYLLLIVIFSITAPQTATWSAFGLLIIGCVVTTAISPFVLGFLLYQFMKVRNFVLNKMVIRSKNKVVVNYDDIDEQGIEGINKFTKKIPVSQPKPQGDKHD